jgi:AcrR family transcriptional regulator
MESAPKRARPPVGRTLGRPPDSDGARTRRTLIAAASRQLAAVGYDAMKLEEVANEAGITRGAIYGYFDSKKDLARAAVLEANPAIEELYGIAVSGVDGLMEQLRILVNVCIKASLANPEPVLGFFQLAKLAENDEELARVFRSRTNGIRRILNDLFARAESTGQLAIGVDRAQAVNAMSGLIFAMAAGVAEAPNEKIRKQLALAAETLVLRDPGWATS